MKFFRHICISDNWCLSLSRILNKVAGTLTSRHRWNKITKVVGRTGMTDYSNESVYGHLRQSIAIIVGAMLFLGVLFSCLYITEEFVHDCTGDECPICRTIAECEAFVDRISTGLIVIISAFFAAFSLLKTVEIPALKLPMATPVSVKVRLNN